MLEVAQAMSRVVATCLLEPLNALEIVDARAKLECRRVIEMMTAEVTVNLLRKNGLLHLLHAIVAPQRLDVEHDERLVVPHLFERLDEHVLAAADHDDLVQQLHVDHRVARHKGILPSALSAAKHCFLQRPLVEVHSGASLKGGRIIAIILVEVLLGTTARVQWLGARSLGQE